MSSSLQLGNFDVLDPTSSVLLAPGFDRGAPVPTVSEIQSTVLDGAAVTGRAASNRRIVLPLLIRASDRVTMATLTNQILSCVDQATWPLTFTPDGGFPVVYDCYRASVAVTSDLIQDADGWQAVTVSCEALPYGRSPTPQTVTLSGSSTQVEGFNATPEPVTVSALLGTVTVTSRATSPAFEGAGSLEVDYVSGATQLRATNSAALSVAVTAALSVASIQVQVPTASSLTTSGNWTLTLATDAGSFTKTQSSGLLPGNGTWSAVSFDMSAIPVGATITGWTLTTPTIRQTSATPATKQTFLWTGAGQTFTVPAGVYSVVVDVSGAGAGNTFTSGGRVKGVLAATPGDVWHVYVGGRGAAPSGLTGGAGGYNFGGAGGNGTGANGQGGFGGGGASDIRIGGTAVSFRKVLAGGAGGTGGGGNTGGLGGNGGASTGGAGQPGFIVGGGGTTASTGGGAGGTQTGPGLGGAGTGTVGLSGSPGAASNGVAGAGGTTPSATNSNGGGGGGGGYWSGGGGGSCGITTAGNPDGGGGGGAGSNYTGGLTAVTSNTQGGGGSYNGSITLSYQTTDKIFFDDLRILPAAVGGVADAYGATYTLPGILGTARTPINVALTKGGGTFGGWVVHTPPADPPTAQELIPLGGASGVAYTTAASVRYNGTYSVWLAAGTFAGGAVSRTWTVTATQSLPASGPSTSTTLTLTPSANNQLYYLGEVTLPITNYPAEASVTTTITVTSTQVADTFLDVLLLDTRGQTIVVDNTATATAAAWIDEPAPTQAFGGVWSGAARTSATSLTSKLLAGSALIQNPGTSQVLLYSPGGALSATVTYSPRWLQEATS